MENKPSYFSLTPQTEIRTGKWLSYFSLGAWIEIRIKNDVF